MSVSKDALLRKLGSIRKAIENDIFEEAAREWIEKDFKPLAKALVHVDSGQLRDSIDGEANGNQARVFADTEYAQIEEEGSSTHTAHPYMRPAFDRTRRKLSEYTRKALRKRL